MCTTENFINPDISGKGRKNRQINRRFKKHKLVNKNKSPYISRIYCLNILKSLMPI